MCVCVCVCMCMYYICVYLRIYMYVLTVVEYREIFGVVFSQRRNDVLFTPDHLKKVVTADKNLTAEVCVLC